MLIDSHDEVDATSDSRFAVMSAESMTRIVNGIYGGTASGIDGETTPYLEPLSSINFKAARLALALSNRMCSQSYY